jgi:hypothetical protein
MDVEAGRLNFRPSLSSDEVLAPSDGILTPILEFSAFGIVRLKSANAFGLPRIPSLVGLT